MSWESLLANEIVIQATKDYRKALRGLKKHKLSSERRINDCENFFRSEWFQILTKIDGELLIRKLKEEHINESKNRRQI